MDDAPATDVPSEEGTEEAEKGADDEGAMEVETEATSGTVVNKVEGDKLLRELHTLLLETQVMEGKMVCGNCGHEYKIKEGIANFLLPNHLV